MSWVNKHVVWFSGGITSWAAAKRVAAEHGTENLYLVFADTRIEDPDLYRFLDEAAANVGGRLIKLQDGRTPWEVFRDVRFIGNSRVDPCSQILKRELLERWRNANCASWLDTFYVGMDHEERDRFAKVRARAHPWKFEAPLTERPYLTKQAIAEWLAREGIELPRLYKLGFPHNNCGGFCVKAGISQFVHLYDQFPERYAEHERQENEIREELGDVSILRDRRGGETKPMTLTALRKRIESDRDSLPKFEWGGCGCAY